MPYLYAENVSPADRFDQIQIELDNGQLGTLHKGGVYDLSPGEIGRAQRYVVLVSSTGTPDPLNGGGASSSGALLVTAPGDAVPTAVGRAADTLWVRRRT